MLALETGWTDDVLAQMPRAFKARCHWALYARAVVGPEGFPSTEIPMHAPAEVKYEAIRLKKEVDAHRALLFPEGDD